MFYSFLCVSIVEFERENAIQDVFDYVSYIKQVNYKNTERNAKINTPPWIFFTFFELYKCYQIAQRTTYAVLSEDFNPIPTV